MANNSIVLEGELRTEFGKGPARRMRVAKEIPATIYAGGDQPVYVKLPMRETSLALRHTNALFTIKFGADSKLAVVKDVQRNPVKRIIEHIDFYEVKAGEKIEVEVPVFVEGTPKGGAIAVVDAQELEAPRRCLQPPGAHRRLRRGPAGWRQHLRQGIPSCRRVSSSISPIRRNPWSPSRSRRRILPISRPLSRQMPFRRKMRRTQAQRPEPFANPCKVTRRLRPVALYAYGIKMSVR